MRTAPERGVDVFKIHVQVGDFDLADPQLAEALGECRGIGTTGRHPRGRPTAVVAHAGA